MKKLIPILLLLAFACKKSNNTTNLQMTDVPLRVGNSWTYLVTNYPVTETDTATFAIVSQTTINSDSTVFKTQTSIRGVVVDSGTISKTSSTSAYTYWGDNGHQFFAGSGLFDGWRLTFPIQPKSGWSTSGGSIQVVASNQTVTIEGIQYINVYTLVRSAITPGGQLADTMLVAPRIGIIKYDGFPLVAYQIQ
jgi:hypothetical protein